MVESPFLMFPFNLYILWLLVPASMKHTRAPAFEKASIAQETFNTEVIWLAL